MTQRTRLTWQRNKQASPPPASYGWTPEHPAFYPDPEADQYENGDTSSWAEDPTKGPYPQGPAPASQSWRPSHPAAKADAMGPIPPPVGPDAGKTAALRARVEQKAAKCIRVASAILGKGASTSAIENKALSLMDLPDRKLDAAMIKMRQAFLTGTGPLAEDLDGDGIDQNDPFTYDFTGEMEIPTPPIMAEDDGIEAEDPEAEAMLASMLAGDDDGIEAEDPEAEAMLASMLAGEDDGVEAEDPEAEAMLAEMLAGKHAEEDHKGGKYAEMALKALDEVKALKAELEALKASKHSPKAEDDPMGLMSEDGGDDDAELASLFGGKLASKKGGKKAEADEDGDDDEPKAGKKGGKKAEADDDGDEPKAGKKALKKKLAALRAEMAKLAAEVEDDDDGETAEDDDGDDEPKAGKKAYQSLFADDDDGDDDGDGEQEEEEEEEVELEDDAETKKEARLRPQTRKASTGVKTLGSVRLASSGKDDLSKLWKAAPDVSDHF